MASRENMGLQIWLMITVMFAVLMAVVASVFYYTNSTTDLKLANKTAELETLNKAIRTKNAEVRVLAMMIEGPTE
ncbi:MAG: hypothetical protein MK364_13330, partial [Pirellulales bacterium]|nr:hypothetical protein [Pirellulales bacterium]